MFTTSTVRLAFNAKVSGFIPASVGKQQIALNKVGGQKCARFRTSKRFASKTNIGKRD
jgi:hypothetical protein